MVWMSFKVLVSFVALPTKPLVKPPVRAPHQARTGNSVKRRQVERGGKDAEKDKHLPCA